MKTKEMNCPVCHEKVYSELKKGCRLCGMPLEDESREFCSKLCRNKFIEIKNNEKNI